jgi:hypothetical protein
MNESMNNYHIKYTNDSVSEVNFHANLKTLIEAWTDVKTVKHDKQFSMPHYNFSRKTLKLFSSNILKIVFE